MPFAGGWCFVRGCPQAKGSKQPGRGKLRDSNPNAAAWQHIARLQLAAAWHGPPLRGPVVVRFHFLMPRPQRVPPERDDQPCVPPDWDKLCRTLGDALKPSVIGDDGQICGAVIDLDYAPTPRDLGVLVQVERRVKPALVPRPLDSLSVAITSLCDGR
ncbi:MAG: RusA family crossover junction endodeoxyribonuclease [Myxococcales bacterium]|nr:RusA family crossover junction endodeoxyribonuclease [Myxococcales bacterium]